VAAGENVRRLDATSVFPQMPCVDRDPPGKWWDAMGSQSEFGSPMDIGRGS